MMHVLVKDLFNVLPRGLNYNSTLGIIPTMHIAGVVTDGRFSSAGISATTQVVLMEEWTANSLSCEEAKRTLQGTK